MADEVQNIEFRYKVTFEDRGSAQAVQADARMRAAAEASAQAQQHGAQLATNAIMSQTKAAQQQVQAFGAAANASNTLTAAQRRQGAAAKEVEQAGKGLASSHNAVARATQWLARTTQGATREIEASRRAFSALGGTMRSIEGQIARWSWRGLQGGVAVIGGLAAAVATTGFKFLDMKQQSQIAFTTMLGSAKAAGAYFQQLTQFAARTPFELPDVLTGAKRLMAMGFAAKDVIGVLRNVGDAAAGLSTGREGIDRMVTALGQMRNAGRVNAQDMNQLIQAGVPAWRYLADAAGKSIAEIRDMSEKGMLNSRAAVRIILAGMDKDFGGLMEKQSHTFGGLVSTLKDTFRIASGNIMQPFFTRVTGWLQDLATRTSDPAFQRKMTQWGQRMYDEVMPRVEAMYRWFRDHWRDIGAFILGAATAAAHFGKAVYNVVHVVSDVLGGTENTIKAVGAAWIGVRAATIAFGVAARVMALGLSVTLRAALISTGIGAVAVAFGLAAMYVMTHWSKVKGWFDSFWKVIKRGAEIAFNGIREIVKTVVYAILQQTTLAIRGVLLVASHLPFVGDKARDALNAINGFIGKWKPDFSKVLGDAGKEAGKSFGDNLTAAATNSVKGAGAAIAAAMAAPATTPGVIAAPGSNIPEQAQYLRGRARPEQVAVAASTYGIPVNLIRAVMGQESGGAAGALSPKGAMGLMQLMPDTAKGLGVTDIKNASQNILGGAKYLGEMLRQFGGDMRKALAAYNAGPNAVQQAVAASPRGWLSLLPQETQQYVPQVMGRIRAAGGLQLPSTAGGASAGVMSRGRQKAIDLAKSMIGTPYAWGGAAPGGFDCSGLVMWALGQGAGINLPHFTGKQVALGHAVTRAAIQPGDVVFSEYSTRDQYQHGTKIPAGTPGHVGIFVGGPGGGTVIQAPHTGARVQPTPFSQFVGTGKYEIRSYFNDQAAAAAAGLGQPGAAGAAGLGADGLIMQPKAGPGDLPQLLKTRMAQYQRAPKQLLPYLRQARELLNRRLKDTSDLAAQEEIFNALNDIQNQITGAMEAISKPLDEARKKAKRQAAAARREAAKSLAKWSQARATTIEAMDLTRPGLDDAIADYLKEGAARAKKIGVGFKALLPQITGKLAKREAQLPTRDLQDAYNAMLGEARGLRRGGVTRTERPVYDFVAQQVVQVQGVIGGRLTQQAARATGQVQLVEQAMQRRGVSTDDPVGARMMADAYATAIRGLQDIMREKMREQRVAAMLGKFGVAASLQTEIDNLDTQVQQYGVSRIQLVRQLFQQQTTTRLDQFARSISTRDTRAEAGMTLRGIGGDTPAGLRRMAGVYGLDIRDLQKEQAYLRGRVRTAPRGTDTTAWRQRLDDIDTDLLQYRAQRAEALRNATKTAIQQAAEKAKAREAAVQAGITAQTEGVMGRVGRRDTRLGYQFQVAGIDPASSMGLGVTVGAQQQDLAELQTWRNTLVQMQQRARAAGNNKRVNAIQRELDGVDDSILQYTAAVAQGTRDRIKARQQEIAARTQGGAQIAQLGYQGLTTALQLGSIGDTSPEGQASNARAQAAYITQNIIPALVSVRNVIGDQLGTASGPDELLAITQQYISAGNDIATQQLEAANLQYQAGQLMDQSARDYAQGIRDAATSTAAIWAQGAQETVQLAQSDMALQQGSFDMGFQGDSPAALRAQAYGIRDQLLPAMAYVSRTIQGQSDAALANNQLNESGAFLVQLRQNEADIVAQQAQMVKLLRQAAELGAQQIVDQAGHRFTMADLGYQGLQLRERLAKTYDTAAGQAERQTYVTQQLIPQLQGQLAALQAQLAVAQQQGDQVLADQVAEAIAGKQNDILQAQLDATEQVATNTDTLRQFGGQLAFGYQNQRFTDAMISSQVGA